MIVKHKKKAIYVCSLTQLELAAKLFDYVAIQLNGHKVNTNFDYTVSEVMALLHIKNLVKFCKSSRR